MSDQYNITFRTIGLGYVVGSTLIGPRGASLFCQEEAVEILSGMADQVASDGGDPEAFILGILKIAPHLAEAVAEWHQAWKAAR